MKDTKKIKSLFIKVCKISLLLFFIALAILVGFAVFTDESEFTLPTIVMIYFLASTIACVLCIVIAWILDLIESVRRDIFTCLMGYLVVIVMFWGVLVAVDYFWNDAGVDLAGSLVKAALSVCAIKAGNYIFTKRNG